MSATPRPWEVTPWRHSFDWGDYKMEHHGAHVAIKDLEGGRGYTADVKAGGLRLVFLTAIDQGEELETAKANARLIVTAVNAHEELLEAAKRMVALGFDHDEWSDEECAVIDALEAAIARAEDRGK